MMALRRQPLPDGRRVVARGDVERTPSRMPPIRSDHDLALAVRAADSGSAYQRRATATPNRNAARSEPSGASRAMLLKMLKGMPGFFPASMAPPILLAVPLTASDTSATVDFGSGAGSRPSWTKGGGSMLIILSSLT